MSANKQGVSRALEESRLKDLEAKIKEGGGSAAAHNALIERAIRLRVQMRLPITQKPGKK